MARARKTTSSEGKKPGGRKKKDSEKQSVTAQALAQNTRDARAKYTNAENTTNAYKGYLARGAEFLASVVAERKKREVDDPTWVCEQGIHTDVLAKAFLKPPNQHSAIALEMYITQKCLVEGLGKSTADGIHGAYAKYWDTMDGDKYAGEYHWNDETNKVTGCPARAGIVTSLVKIIKIRDAEKGAAATRNHAEAMSVEDMVSLMDWSESVCPTSKLVEATKAGAPPTALAERLLLLKHGLMRGFASSSFTLWTRNFELCGLQMRDLTLDCVGPLPSSHPYFKVFLDGRKGWQHKQGYDGKRESNEYNIYGQPDLPAVDMYQYLLTWLPFYELCLGRKLEPDDYIFPYISSNGTIHAKREMTLQMCQDLITEFTVGAGLQKTYTTHSFRRGGAQYRFMFAPPGKRWSLNIVRWWGGWAIGEHVDTLMKYLLDSLQSYETGHADALCPVQHEVDKSFMGEHLLVKPVTVGEFRATASEIMAQLKAMSLDAKNSHPRQATPMLSAGHSTRSPLLPSTAPPQTSAAHQDASAEEAPSPHTPSRPNSRAPTLSERVEVISGVFIPDLKKGDGAWLEAVRQWEHGDEAQGLKPLRDWPREWYSDGMRKVTGTKRSHRKLIFDEYERPVLGLNESEFIKTYPEAHKRISKLINAIRESNKARGVTIGRRSKRGSTR
ncbi:hypothetical protein R3P38DRAFT_2542938 [Favolaschia claudopus]|uniref:Integrase n=1 Tax=Favolaschia claudopus TaxID=2862362 RepID=A0AAW0ATK0_9AGAR